MTVTLTSENSSAGPSVRRMATLPVWVEPPLTLADDPQPVRMPVRMKQRPMSMREMLLMFL